MTARVDAGSVGGGRGRGVCGERMELCVLRALIFFFLFSSPTVQHPIPHSHISQHCVSRSAFLGFFWGVFLHRFLAFHL